MKITPQQAPGLHFCHASRGEQRKRPSRRLVLWRCTQRRCGKARGRARQHGRPRTQSPRKLFEQQGQSRGTVGLRFQEPKDPLLQIEE